MLSFSGAARQSTVIAPPRALFSLTEIFSKPRLPWPFVHPPVMPD